MTSTLRQRYQAGPMPEDPGLASPALIQRAESFFSDAVSTGALLASSEAYREVRATYRNSYFNFFLILVPIAIAAGAIGWPPVAVFWLNFLAMIPLAPLIWLSVVELSVMMGHYLGGILRATCVNAVEMIVVITALAKDQTRIVQVSLIGSILSYSLLVLGSIFFFASYKKEKVDFDKTLTSVMSSLIMVVLISLIIPTMVSVKMEDSEPGTISHKDMIFLSHGIAIVLFTLFLVYLYFRLQTHRNLFHYGQYGPYTRRPSVNNTDQEDPDSRLSAWATGFILITGTVPTCVCAWYLVDSVDGMVKATNMSKAFIGLILIPAVGNAAKCISMVGASRKTAIDLAIRTIMSSVLNSLLVMFPFSILLGWTVRKPIYLDFDVFEATILFLSIIVMTCLMQYGRTNYFEGLMLMGTYLVITIAFYLRPDTSHKGFAWILERN